MIPVYPSTLDTNLIPASTKLNSGWQQQLAKSIKTVAELLDHLGLKESDLPYRIDPNQAFPLRVTHFLASLIDPSNPYDPVLLQILPLAEESQISDQFYDDPLEESDYNPVPGLIHKYRSRVLLIAHQACALHCRYCFRRHFPYSDNSLTATHLKNIVRYLEQHTEVNEVILSGGDPLVLSDSKLRNLIQQLESVSHLKRIRIHTRTPVAIPERLTEGLLDALTDSRLQATIVLHLNHPVEVTSSLSRHLEPYRRAGITLLNQSVLLKGINDNPEILNDLSEKLFESGILPYYLHTTDAVSGASHFYVDLDRAQSIWRSMMSELSGYLVPKLVQEIPAKANKTWVNPNDCGQF